MVGSSSRFRPRLTERERQALLYAAAGRTRREAAAVLGVEEPTVRTFQLRATAKLAGVNVRHAASRALLLGTWTLAEIDAAAVEGRAMRPQARSAAAARPPI